MPMLQRFLSEAPLPCASVPPVPRRVASLQHCPIEIVEQTLGYLDALSLHFAARTCRALYFAAQGPQARQCVDRRLATSMRPAPKVRWHAQHSALARVQARWMLGVAGAHSATATPPVAGYPPALIPMCFAGRHVVLCDSAGVCMVAACGDLHWRLTDPAFVDLVDAQGRADGTLVTRSQTHLSLHDVRTNPAVLLAQTPAAWPGEARIAQHPEAPYLVVQTQTHLDVYQVDGLMHVRRIDVACQKAGVHAPSTCVFSYDRAGFLRAFALPAAQLLWERAVAPDAEMTVLDEAVVMHTARRTTLYDPHAGRLCGTFRPPHPAARYHRTPSPDHLWVSFVPEPGAKQIRSRMVQMQTGEALGPERVHPGEALAVSADGVWLAVQTSTQVTFTRMRPPRALLQHYR